MKRSKKRGVASVLVYIPDERPSREDQDWLLDRVAEAAELQPWLAVDLGPYADDDAEVR